MTMLFDVTRWPLVLVRQQGSTSDAQFEQYLSELDALHVRQEAFVMVLDLRAGVPFSFTQRARQNRWIAEHPEYMTKLLGIAFVENSWAMRSAMKAVLFASPPSYPYTVTGEIGEALAWAERRSRRCDGLSISPAP